MKTVIVLPTYNESENIEQFVNLITKKIEEIGPILNFDIKILVVDDFSPDGTADIVSMLIKDNKNLFILNNSDRGLGNAYIKGFKYAIDSLGAEIVVEMDSDLSHNPDDLILLLNKIKEGYDFVIGSRYVDGGSIPSNWGILRKLNSYCGNLFARHIAGLKSIFDCTSGYRAIRADIIKQINLDMLNVNGYSFQLNILFYSTKCDAKITEIPIKFIDRTKGKSKLRFKDIIEFIINSIKLGCKRTS